VVAKAFVSLVTVCGASDMLVQTTCVPFGIDSVAGSKEYFPLFSTIFTFITAADVGLAGEVAAVVGLACEAVGVGVVAVPPPHAAKIMVARATKDRIPQTNRKRTVLGNIYFPIGKTSSVLTISVDEQLCILLFYREVRGWVTE